MILGSLSSPLRASPPPDRVDFPPDSIACYSIHGLEGSLIGSTLPVGCRVEWDEHHEEATPILPSRRGGILRRRDDVLGRGTSRDAAWGAEVQGRPSTPQGRGWNRHLRAVRQVLGIGGAAEGPEQSGRCHGRRGGSDLPGTRARPGGPARDLRDRQSGAGVPSGHPVAGAGAGDLRGLGASA